MKLRERYHFPIECAKLCDHPLITAKMQSELRSKYLELETLINEKEQEIFNAWAETVPEIIELHLSKPLLRVGDDQLLELNFDTELTTLLREIRYMIIMKRTDLSEEALNFYDSSEFYSKSTYDLTLITNWYNRIRSESVPVEFQLIEDEVEEIDKLINYGQENYNWKSPGTDVRMFYALINDSFQCM
ncbi:dynein axonemal heavy chain 9-like [Halictus rubicundus]|uniref:dynein axonemal heavy chain 9-like n=1 Tax=Halictus rubicundus TaxID=77578 RepID=UPI0040375A3D